MFCESRIKIIIIVLFRLVEFYTLDIYQFRLAGISLYLKNLF